jgi:putative NADPH-quinone reductase
MTKSILIIQGHPDPGGNHLCHGLADAYAEGAKAAGHSVERIGVAELDFPLLRTKESFETGGIPVSLAPCQDAIARADHLLIIYPLWLGEMPAILKAFFEQTFRPGFAYAMGAKGWTRKLSGKSARIVVTIGMPPIFYRWYFGAHGLKCLKRSILGFCGIGPIRDSLFGMVEAASPATRAKWLEKMRALGRAAA